MGEHQATVGRSEIWLTPRWILDALGPFDLDPCAAPSPRPWPTAARHIELPEDGLRAPWDGRVWLNPPYGAKTGLWLQRLAEHGRGTALVFARTETQAWHQWVWPKASGLFFITGRLTFHNADGSPGAGTAGAPSALVAYGREDARRLLLARLSGTFVSLDWARAQAGQ